METITLQTSTVGQTVDLGRRLGEILQCGDVVALVGALGAGKTQLTRGIAHGLGANPAQVASPTFVLMSEYDAPTPLVHIDAYRIQSFNDLESIGFTEELLKQSVTVIEWADRIAHELPSDHLWVELHHTEGGRSVALTARGAVAERLGGLISKLTDFKSPSPCRTCGRSVASDAASFPFCSDRCRLVDLNRWFKGNYSLSRPLDEEDLTP
jgi:tRNA threonylcarbamoyladenosine biosynthesis protein TsaE